MNEGPRHGGRGHVHSENSGSRPRSNREIPAGCPVCVPAPPGVFEPAPVWVCLTASLKHSHFPTLQVRRTLLRVEGADASMRARGGAARAAGRVVTLAGRAGGRAPHMPHAPPQVLPHLTLGGRLSLHPDSRTSCCGAVWGLCFGCELISWPKVLVVYDRWLEDSCTGSSP